jgi:aquaporin Z
MAVHWHEAAVDGALLGLFMLAACTAVAAVCHPGSPVSSRVRRPLTRRAVLGLLMGATAVTLIYSGPGQWSGAHLNPGVTLTFAVLGRVAWWDAACYAAAQVLGAVAGVGVARLALGRAVAHTAVGYAATRPGRWGTPGAWLGEFVIAFSLMLTVLWSSNRAATAGYTGVLAGGLVAVFITVEAPVSGMSMNPARTLGSAVWARDLRGLWVYFTAPPLAMLLAAWVYTGTGGEAYCAKLRHPHGGSCQFRCRIGDMPGWEGRRGGAEGIEGHAAPR